MMATHQDSEQQPIGGSGSGLGSQKRSGGGSSSDLQASVNAALSGTDVEAEMDKGKSVVSGGNDEVTVASENDDADDDASLTEGRII